MFSLSFSLWVLCHQVPSLPWKGRQELVGHLGQDAELQSLGFKENTPFPFLLFPKAGLPALLACATGGGSPGGCPKLSLPSLKNGLPRLWGSRESHTPTEML